MAEKSLKILMLLHPKANKINPEICTFKSSEIVSDCRDSGVQIWANNSFESVEDSVAK